jgi:predicted permease
MLQILTLTAPVYLLIALGYLAGRFEVFSRDELRVMGRFVISFALPALLFKALSQRPVSEILNLNYLLAYGAGSVASWFTMAAIARRVRGQVPVKAALVGMGCGLSNSGFVGFPIALALLGHGTASVALALNMLVENIIMLPLALVLLETAAKHGSQSQAWNDVAWRTVVNLRKNPLIIAMVLGLAVATLGLPLPTVLVRATDLLAAASAPVALFVIGGSLIGFKGRGQMGDVTMVAAGKLLLHPTAVALAFWAVSTWVGPVDPLLRTAGIVYACMPMLSIFPLLAQKHGFEGFTSAALVVATVASFVTLSTALWGMHQFLPGWLP